jgi:hypothetical protein
MWACTVGKLGAGIRRKRPPPPTMERLLSTLKDNLATGVRLYPIFIGLAALTIFIGTSNIAYMFLGLSLLLLIPAVVAFSNFVLPKLLTLLGLPDSTWAVSANTQCLLESTKELGKQAVPMIPSYWLTAATFIAVYLIKNAYDLYNKDTGSADAAKTSARKSQSIIALVAVLVFTVILVVARIGPVFRSTVTRIACESPLGIVVGLGLGYGLAQAIYSYMVDCTGFRNADLFGIAGRIIQVRDNGVACYPVS